MPQKDFNKKINTIIEEALQDKTFSLEAVDRIKEIRDEFAECQEKLESAQKQIGEVIDEKIEKDKEIRELKEENETLAKRNEALENTVKGYEEREETIRKKEFAIQLIEKRGDEMKELALAVIGKEVRRRYKSSGYREVMNENGYKETLNQEHEVEETLETDE